VPLPPLSGCEFHCELLPEAPGADEPLELPELPRLEVLLWFPELLLPAPPMPLDCD